MADNRFRDDDRLSKFQKGKLGKAEKKIARIKTKMARAAVAGKKLDPRELKALHVQDPDFALQVRKINAAKRSGDAVAAESLAQEANKMLRKKHAPKSAELQGVLKGTKQVKSKVAPGPARVVGKKAIEGIKKKAGGRVIGRIGSAAGLKAAGKFAAKAALGTIAAPLKVAQAITDVPALGVPEEEKQFMKLREAQSGRNRAQRVLAMREKLLRDKGEE